MQVRLLYFFLQWGQRRRLQQGGQNTLALTGQSWESGFACFLGLPDLDPIVKGTDPAPVPSIKFWQKNNIFKKLKITVGKL
jgi:hypothetical protein